MHIMVDLETMGTGADAPIIAIGAVAFNAQGIQAQTFYKAISLGSALESGAKVDGSTIVWWMQQSDEARMAAVKGSADLGLSMERFSEWVRALGAVDGVWGNGASFDNAILSATYRRLGKEQPWPFWQDRCYRTIKSLYTDVTMERTGTHHNALDDAFSQAQHLLEICAKHGVPI